MYIYRIPKNEDVPLIRTYTCGNVYRFYLNADVPLDLAIMLW